ncbi:MAG: primosomal protein N' [Alphaproteobacteria bacterium]|nr:primosomal protein N' [Alphaproteobacteria bacterium]
MQVQVLVPTGVNVSFTYEAEKSVAVGEIVIVPFRSKSTLGVIWSDKSADFKGTAKTIEATTGFILPEAMMKFVNWVSDYTMTQKGLILRMVLALPFLEFKKLFKKLYVPHTEIYEFPHNIQLSYSQEEAARKLKGSLGEFQPFLLDGITGSGKTEVYLSALEDVLKKGGQALVLLPEISLTSQWLERFERRFGIKPLLWHSDIPMAQKRKTWQRLIKGEPVAVVGARSALFLPFAKLSFIVVDEEHDSSYKQEEQVLYNARDMAVVRAQLSNIPIVLASATPSLETIVNVQKGRYQFLHLADRFAGAELPNVSIVDMRLQSKGVWLAEPLLKAIEERLFKNEQTLLFLNRRGYAPLTLCRACGHRFMCPGCAAWLVQHKNMNQLCCHHCGFSKPLPNSCEQCEAVDTLVPCGPGVERIYEEVLKKFPKARVLMVTSDLISTSKQASQMIEKIESGQIDIIIGTQMLAKGHHFPMLTLVGALDADLGLNGGDLRSGERTYQLLHQVSGRAGREERGGEVMLQTYHPDHPIMQALKDHDRERFYVCETEERQLHEMPPFGRLAAVILSGLNADQVETAAHKLARFIPPHSQITVLGPVPAPLARLRGRYRWRFLVKADRPIRLQPFLQNWLQKATLPQTIRVAIDIDPQSFM